MLDASKTAPDKIRSTIISQRQQLSLSDISACAQRVCDQVLACSLVQQAHNIALYAAHAGELSTLPLLDALWDRKKNCCLPCIQSDKSLVFHAYRRNDKLLKHPFGILEPDPAEHLIVPLDKIDLFIMPLVAFDVRGNRLGYGAGCYDRTFGSLKNSRPFDLPPLIGLAYEFQKTSDLKANAWDIPLDLIVTESRMYILSP